MCNRVRCATSAFVVGALLIGGSFLTVFLIGRLIQSTIDDGVTLKPESADSSAYNEWLTYFDAKDPAKYWNVRFFNITNVDAVALQTTLPFMQETATYTFREYITKYDVQFNADDTQVTYREQKNYTYDPTGSTAPQGSLNDMIYAPWVPLHVAFAQSGTYSVLSLALSRAAISNAALIYAGLWNQLNPANTTDQANQVAAMQWAGLVGNPSLNISANQSYAESGVVIYALTMANQVVPVELLLNLKANSLFPEYEKWRQMNDPTVAPIPVNLAYQLLFPYDGSPCGCPLTSTVGGSPFPCVAFLEAPDQGSNICPWLTEKSRKSIKAYLAATHDRNLRTIAQLGNTVQWNNAKLTTEQVIMGMMYRGRTPASWLFDMTLDPFTIYVGEPQLTAFFPSNYSTPDQARAADPVAITILQTGKHDIPNAQSYIEWRNTTSLPMRANHDPSSPTGYYCGGASPVTGHLDQQYPPGTATTLGWKNTVSSDSTLEVFVEDLYRMGYFVHDSDVSVKGIDVKRFTIADQSFSVLPVFDQYYYGLVNFTCVQGAPVLLCEPHFHRARNTSGCPGQCFPKSWEVNGTDIYVSDPAIHETYLDIDPVTGAVLRGYQRLQINVLVSVEGGAKHLVPALWVEEHVELTDDQASDYKSKLIFIFRFRRGLFYGMLLFGCVLFAAGVSFAMYYHKRAQAAQGTVQTTTGDDMGEPLMAPGTEGY